MGLQTRRIGEAWVRDATLEHASVASFARATLELMAHGAPEALIEATQRASLDEIKHARLCFGLASKYLGREISAGAVEACGPRGGSLADLAVRVFVEGCVGETIAALVAEESLAVCTDADVRAALTVIAADEARHAELAWATLAWAVKAGGQDVRDALARECARMNVDGRECDAGPALKRRRTADDFAAHGRLSHEVEARIASEAWTDVILPAVRLLSRTS